MGAQSVDQSNYQEKIVSRRKKLESALEGFFSPLEDPADAVIDVESLRPVDLGADLSDQSVSGQHVLAPPIVSEGGDKAQTGLPYF